jgi:hypothetical protein
MPKVKVKQHSRMNPNAFFDASGRVKAHSRQSPEKRARKAQLRKALVIALQGLPEREIADIVGEVWLTPNRLDLLQERLP